MTQTTGSTDGNLSTARAAGGATGWGLSKYTSVLCHLQIVQSTAAVAWHAYANETPDDRYYYGTRREMWGTGCRISSLATDSSSQTGGKTAVASRRQKRDPSVIFLLSSVFRLSLFPGTPKLGLKRVAALTLRCSHWWQQFHPPNSPQTLALPHSRQDWPGFGLPLRISTVSFIRYQNSSLGRRSFQSVPTRSRP